MTTSKKLIAFVLFPLLFLSVIIFGIITSEMEYSHTRRESKHVNPTGHLTVDTELGTIHIETTNRNDVDIATEKKWESKSGLLRPKLWKRVGELLKDFEITIEYDNPESVSSVQIEGKFKRGREYWQEGLKWFLVLNRNNGTIRAFRLYLPSRNTNVDINAFVLIDEHENRVASYSQQEKVHREKAVAAETYSRLELFVERPPPPLTLFSAGLDKHLGTTVEIYLCLANSISRPALLG